MTTEANERMKRPLATVDPEIDTLLGDEARREATGLELIPSENLVSEAVLAAMGSIFTNKYAEGYPGKRYYGGCEVADKVEQLAIDRAKQLFGAEHANVQAHSGTSANVAVYMSVLQPGDTVLGMALAHGGHLTHGHPLNFSGRMYKFVEYHVRKDTEQIDYEEIEKLAQEHKPKMIVAGASAYPRIIEFEPGFKEYQKQIAANAKAMAAAVASKGFRLVSGGTDNHLFLIEVHPRGITGSEAEKALDRAGITVNKNSIPFDPLPPMKAGGIRLGSPSVTTRGMKEPEMQFIGGWVAEVLGNVGNAEVEQRVRQQVAELAGRFPIYESRLRSAAVHARV